MYSGNGTYYEDSGLTLFTTYLYRVAVINDYYYTVGPNSSPVVTNGGTPVKPVTVSVAVVNYTTVNINWTLPSMYIILLYDTECIDCSFSSA